MALTFTDLSALVDGPATELLADVKVAGFPGIVTGQLTDFCAADQTVLVEFTGDTADELGRDHAWVRAADVDAVLA